MGVDAGREHGVEVVEGEPVQPLHHQHTCRHQVGVGSRDDVASLVEVGERGGHVEHRVGFEAEVELLGDRVGEHLDERRGVGQRRDRDTADQERRQPGHDLEVLVDGGSDPGALHLDDHLGAVEQGGPVDLSDGCGGERHRVDRREDRVEPAAEVVLDDRAHGVERLGGYLVSALDELGDQLVGEHPPTRRDDLAELDVGRSQPLGRDAEASRDRGPRPGAAVAPVEDPPPGDRPAEVPGDGEHPTPRREPAGRDQARHLAPDGGADRRHPPPPTHGGGVDQPRWVVGEGAVDEVAGCGHDRRAARAAGASSGRQISRSGR